MPALAPPSLGSPAGSRFPRRDRLGRGGARSTHRSSGECPLRLAVVAGSYVTGAILVRSRLTLAMSKIEAMIGSSLVRNLHTGGRDHGDRTAGSTDEQTTAGGHPSRTAARPIAVRGGHGSRRGVVLPRQDHPAPDRTASRRRLR